MSNEIALELRKCHLTYPVRKSSLEIHQKTIFNIFHRKDEITSTLKDISLQIMKGEVIGILGHNGAGKSTLLRLLSGIYQPDRGSVRVNGKISLLHHLVLVSNETLGQGQYRSERSTSRDTDRKSSSAYSISHSLFGIGRFYR